MRLTTKATLFITVILLLLTGVQFYIQKTVIYPGFDKIERESATRNMQRCRDAVEREIYHLDLLAKDWSNWDDTYHFAQNRNQLFIDTNITPDTFENGQLNFIYVFNDQQELVYYRHHNLAGLNTPAKSETEETSRPVHERILALKSKFFSEDYVHGLTDVLPSPLMLASCTLLTSNKEGPSHGRLIMGRQVSDSLIHQLCKQTHMQFGLKSRDLIKPEQTWILQALQQSCELIDYPSDSQLSIYSAYHDLDGHPSFLLEANLPRQITLAGKNTIVFALIPTLSILACSLFLLLYVMECYMITPINDFSDQLKLIRRTRDFHERVTVPKEPEISRLAQEFNRLMKRLSVYYKKRNLAEEKLQQAVRQADYANSSKSIFLANMSHEIRTPMNAILGFSDLLWEENLTSTQKDYVHTIRTSGQSLLELINDILDLSKIEAGKMVIEYADCSLNGLLENVYALMEPLAKQKNIDFKINKVRNCPETFYTDALRLKQCLINLVGNAIKFTLQGHVYINLYTDEDKNGPFICLAVEDTGMGIAADRQSAIFEAFTQSDGATSHRFGGTGLGLTITKKLVEMMHGQLTVQSELGKGSVFTIRLRQSIAENASKPEIAQAAS